MMTSQRDRVLPVCDAVPTAVPGWTLSLACGRIAGSVYGSVRWTGSLVAHTECGIVVKRLQEAADGSASGADRCGQLAHAPGGGAAAARPARREQCRLGAWAAWSGDGLGQSLASKAC